MITSFFSISSLILRFWITAHPHKDVTYWMFLLIQGRSTVLHRCYMSMYILYEYVYFIYVYISACVYLSVCAFRRVSTRIYWDNPCH